KEHRQRAGGCAARSGTQQEINPFLECAGGHGSNHAAVAKHTERIDADESASGHAENASCCTISDSASPRNLRNESPQRLVLGQRIHLLLPRMAVCLEECAQIPAKEVCIAGGPSLALSVEEDGQ